MADAPKTTITYQLNGSNKDFPIPFEYLSRKFVQVTLIGVDRKVLVLNIDYRFTQRTIITLTKNWGPANGYQLVEIRRYTSATERLVDFSDGSILRAYDLNTSQVQSLHIAEEGRDIATDTIGINSNGELDARGRKIVNLADGVNDYDAVNMRQQILWAGSAKNQAERAAAEAGMAAVQAGASATSATNSWIHSTESARQANASRSEAAISASHARLAAAWASNPEGSPIEGGHMSSFAYAGRSGAYSLNSQQSAVNSQASAELSYGHSQSAFNSAGTATTQAAKAKAEADRSKTEADRAKAEADKLGNMNELGGAVESVVNLSVRWKERVIAPAFFAQSDGAASFGVANRDGSDAVYFTRPTRTDRYLTLWDAKTDSARVLFHEGGAMDVTGLITAKSGLDVKGSAAITGNARVSSATVDNTLTAGSVQSKNLIAAADTAGANCHMWFHDHVGVERGLIYADSGRKLHIRANAGNTRGEGIVVDEANRVTISRDAKFGEGTVSMPHPSGTLWAGLYSESNLLLQGTGSAGIAKLGFLNTGRTGLALYLNNDGALWTMRDDGSNQLLLTNVSLMDQIGGNMTSGIIGAVCSLYNASGRDHGQNALVSGGQLRLSTNNSQGPAPAGSWRNLGWSNAGGVSVWVRYA